MVVRLHLQVARRPLATGHERHHKPAARIFEPLLRPLRDDGSRPATTIHGPGLLRLLTAVELRIQLAKAEHIKDEIHRQSEHYIKENSAKIARLEEQLRESDASLQKQLEAQREAMLYENKQAYIALERQKRVSAAIGESGIRKDILVKLNTCDSCKKVLTTIDWRAIEQEIEQISSGFKIRLYNLYSKLSENEYHICLLIKLGFQPTEIAKLTLHSKESITSTRRRLYEKVFAFITLSAIANGMP